jgi:hypothetical protein
MLDIRSCQSRLDLIETANLYSKCCRFIQRSFHIQMNSMVKERFIFFIAIATAFVLTQILRLHISLTYFASALAPGAHYL